MISTLLWFLFLVIVLAMISKYIFRRTITWKEIGIQIFIISIVTSVIITLGSYQDIYDTEIWNGEILSKQRIEDTYLESYQCNCYTSCIGTGNNRSCSEYCQTCYTRHYTVEWSAETNISKITFNYLDETSKEVYATPSPQSYLKCEIGEAVALEKTYVNYVKAVPESLFNISREDVLPYEKSVPSYPNVYSFYKIDRILLTEAIISPLLKEKLNNNLAEILKDLGPKKQVNIILIITTIKDPSFSYTVRSKWLGGKKNDVIVFLGIEGLNIIWADVMTWALNKGNELFQVKLRDDLLNLKTIDDVELIATIKKNTEDYYNRPHMQEFENLKDEIDPPSWLLILAFVFVVVSSFGCSYFLHRNDFM